MNISRRSLIKTTGVASLGILFAANRAIAAEGAEPTPVPQVKELKLASTINKNHGHQFSAAITLTDVVLLLQQVHLGGKNSLVSIQGTSGHSHTVTLSEENLLQLLRISTLELDSSTDSGHSHAVKLQLIDPQET